MNELMKMIIILYDFFVWKITDFFKNVWLFRFKEIFVSFLFVNFLCESDTNLILRKMPIYQCVWVACDYFESLLNGSF